MNKAKERDKSRSCNSKQQAPFTRKDTGRARARALQIQRYVLEPAALQVYALFLLSH